MMLRHMQHDADGVVLEISPEQLRELAAAGEPLRITARVLYHPSHGVSLGIDAKREVVIYPADKLPQPRCLMWHGVRVSDLHDAHIGRVGNTGNTGRTFARKYRGDDM